MSRALYVCIISDSGFHIVQDRRHIIKLNRSSFLHFYVLIKFAFNLSKRYSNCASKYVKPIVHNITQSISFKTKFFKNVHWAHLGHVKFVNFSKNPCH